MKSHTVHCNANSCIICSVATGVLVFSWAVQASCVNSVTQVFHPNIDLEGNICLNILREDWKPVLSISSIIYGLQFLFLVSTPRTSRHCLYAPMRHMCDIPCILLDLPRYMLGAYPSDTLCLLCPDSALDAKVAFVSLHLLYRYCSVR